MRRENRKSIISYLKDTMNPSSPASFTSRYPMDVSVERLREYVRTTFADKVAATFAPSDVAVGRVERDYVQLRRAPKMFIRRSPAPLFHGRFVATETGISLVGSFGISIANRILLGYMLGFCVLWTTLATIIAAWSIVGLFQHQQWALVAPYVAIMPFIGIAMTYGVCRYARFTFWNIGKRDIDFLSSIIAEALGG